MEVQIIIIILILFYSNNIDLCTIKRQVEVQTSANKAIPAILTASKRATYKLYGTYEGVLPNRRVAVYKSGRQPTVNDCGDCKVYDNGAAKLTEVEVVLFWIGRPENNKGDVYEIMEESVDINTMICLTTAASPDMLWLKGTKNPQNSNSEEIPMKNSAIDLTADYPDLTALKQTNQDAIDDANSRIASVNNNSTVLDETGSNNPTRSPNDVGVSGQPHDVDAGDRGNSNDLTSRAPFETGASVNSNDSSLLDDNIFARTSNEGNDDEMATDETSPTMLPERVLKSEKQLVSALSNLNDLRKKVYQLEIQVGGHRIVLRTFHYPEINLETPINKLRRTYIDADDLPNLFSYEFKSALTSQVKVLEMLAAVAVANSNY